MKESGLACADPRAVESVLRAVRFVEEQMGNPVGVQDMARAACYSQFYFSRLFALATGHSPYDYLMRRRIAVAALEVTSGTRSFTTIALDFGFEAPDSFARAFRRCFGMLPSDARKAGTFPRRIARTQIYREYVEALLEKSVGPPGRLETGDIFLVNRDARPVAGTEFFEIVTRGDDLGPSRSFLGVRANPTIPAFPEMATRLPGGTYARFPLSGRVNGLGMAVEFAYRAWLPESGCTDVPVQDIVEYGEAGPEALLIPMASGFLAQPRVTAHA